jgi:hypothetical protein
MAHLCGEFTYSTMFTRGGTAMYEQQPDTPCENNQDTQISDVAVEAEQ